MSNHSIVYDGRVASESYHLRDSVGWGVTVTRTESGDVLCTCYAFSQALFSWTQRSRVKHPQQFFGAKHPHGCKHVDYVVDQLVPPPFSLTVTEGQRRFEAREAATRRADEASDHGRKHVNQAHAITQLRGTVGELATRVRYLEDGAKLAAGNLRKPRKPTIPKTTPGCTCYGCTGLPD